MPPGDRFVAEVTFHVRYAETDAMGIVHHASYIVYFEEGRSHYSRERGANYADFEKAGLALAVAEVHARYHSPAVYAQEVTVRCWVSDLKSRSMTFSYEIVDTATSTVLVTGYSKHICIDRDHHVTRLPDWWRERLRG